MSHAQAEDETCERKARCSVRERISQIVEKAEDGDRISHGYDILISLTAIVSMLPLMFKQQAGLLKWLIPSQYIFVSHCILWMSYDYISKWFHGRRSAMVIYPVTPLALIDLLFLLPSLGLLGHAFRFLRMFRIFKLFHYSQSFSRILAGFRQKRRKFWALC